MAGNADHEPKVKVLDQWAPYHAGFGSTECLFAKRVDDHSYAAGCGAVYKMSALRSSGREVTIFSGTEKLNFVANRENCLEVM